jgi:heme-degrading monooxygenase HmoA
MITAMVEMKTDEGSIEELIRLAMATMHIFDKQKGFISKKLLKNSDNNKLIQIIEWQSIEDAQACMMSSDWQCPEAIAFMQFIQSGKTTMSPENLITLE